MNTYQIFIDVAQDENWEEIDVESTTIEAFNCNDAYMRANEEAEEKYEHFYVWEVSEEDVI